MRPRIVQHAMWTALYRTVRFVENICAAITATADHHLWRIEKEWDD